MRILLVKATARFLAWKWAIVTWGGQPRVRRVHVIDGRIFAFPSFCPIELLPNGKTSDPQEVWTPFAGFSAKQEISDTLTEN